MRAVYGWLHVVVCGLRYLWHFLRVIYGKINPWTIERRFLTSKILPLLLRIHNSFCELLWVVTSYMWIPPSYYGCLLLTTSWQSVRTHKKNLCMWTGYKPIYLVVTEAGTNIWKPGIPPENLVSRVCIWLHAFCIKISSKSILILINKKKKKGWFETCWNALIYELLALKILLFNFTFIVSSA